MKGIFIGDDFSDKESELQEWFNKGFIIHDKIRFEETINQRAGWLFVLITTQHY